MNNLAAFTARLAGVGVRTDKLAFFVLSTATPLQLAIAKLFSFLKFDVFSSQVCANTIPYLKAQIRLSRSHPDSQIPTPSLK